VKAKTDEECLALARKSMRHVRWCTVIIMVGAGLWGITSVGFLRLAHSYGRDLSGAMVWAGFSVGLACGLLGGLMVLCGLVRFAESVLSLQHPRVARLMVRYHDALAGEVPRDEV
jgi:hypothetical protein